MPAAISSTEEENGARRDVHVCNRRHLLLLLVTYAGKEQFMSGALVNYLIFRKFARQVICFYGRKQVADSCRPTSPAESRDWFSRHT